MVTRLFLLVFGFVLGAAVTWLILSVWPDGWELVVAVWAILLMLGLAGLIDQGGKLPNQS